MAQNFTPKQSNYLSRLSDAVTQFLEDTDALIALAAEYQNDEYGSGAANALTDAVVQGVLPASTAALVFSGMGSFSNSGAILPTIAANRQTLELSFRP